MAAVSSCKSAAIDLRVLASTLLMEDETAVTAPMQEQSEEAQSVRAIVQQEIRAALADLAGHLSASREHRLPWTTVQPSTQQTGESQDRNQTALLNELGQ